MTLTLNLPSEVEEYLLQEAHQKGLSIESVTLQLLTSLIVLRQKQTKAVNLLQSWIDDEDIEEQKEKTQKKEKKQKAKNLRIFRKIFFDSVQVALCNFRRKFGADRSIFKLSAIFQS